MVSVKQQKRQASSQRDACGMEITMELAVLADIHSNHVALEKCMEYALERGISDFLFLGDYLGADNGFALSV